MLAAALLIASASAIADAADAVAAAPVAVLATADAAWARRDEGRTGARADARPISQAVSGYLDAAAESSSVEARWKLARALFFEGKFTGLSREEQRARYERARRAGEEAIALLRSAGRDSGADRDAAPAYFWTAVAWGEWAQVVPKVTAGRAGAAAKIRDYASRVISLDPAFEEGGGYRVLGRLHHRAPRIPIFTPWVSRAEALRNLRLAVRTAPRNFVNRLFLAEALADGDGEQRDEAVRIAKELLAESPSAAHRVEDVAVQEVARRDLTLWAARS
jgi:hypothetical protein